jgi:protein-disulfide isomerase
MVVKAARPIARHFSPLTQSSRGVAKQELLLMDATVWEAVLALPVSPKRDHIRGPLDAPVTLVKYGDYQCPHCALAHDVVDAIQARAGTELCFVYRHFPMTTIHPHAEQAAEAAEAAGAQGKFWQMHDTLFANQQQLAMPNLLAYAEAIGLDDARFGRDMATHACVPKIREDFMSGIRSGVNGTPTFYINGVRHDGGWDAATLWVALQDAAATQRG